MYVLPRGRQMDDYKGYKTVGSESLDEAIKQLKELRENKGRQKQEKDMELVIASITHVAGVSFLTWMIAFVTGDDWLKSGLFAILMWGFLCLALWGVFKI